MTLEPVQSTPSAPPATAPPAPDGLGNRGRDLWAAITDGLEFRADELAILGQACAVADEVAVLEEELAGKSRISEGSAGQPVAHPLLKELRDTRAQLAGLLARIDIPEEGASKWDGLSASERARKASRARWDKSSG